MDNQIPSPNKKITFKRTLFHGGFFCVIVVTAFLFFLNPLMYMVDTYAYQESGWIRVPAVIENKILTDRTVTSGYLKSHSTRRELIYKYLYKYQYLDQEYQGEKQLVEYWVPHEKTPTGIGEVTKIWVLEKDPSQSRFQFPVYVQHFILSCLIGAGIIFGLYRLRKYLMKRIPFYAIPPATKRERKLAKRGEF